MVPVGGRSGTESSEGSRDMVWMQELPARVTDDT